MSPGGELRARSAPNRPGPPSSPQQATPASPSPSPRARSHAAPPRSAEATARARARAEGAGGGGEGAGLPFPWRPPVLLGRSTAVAGRAALLAVARAVPAAGPLCSLGAMSRLGLQRDLQEAAALERRRQRELQRQSRIFNARVRTIGVRARPKHRRSGEGWRRTPRTPPGFGVS